MNTELEMLQEIYLTTQKGDVVALQLNTLRNHFRLTGFYNDMTARTSSWLSFDQKWSPDAAALFTTMLTNLAKELTRKGDSVMRIDNPCNALYLPAEQQRDIVQNRGLRADVSVNAGINRH